MSRYILIRRLRGPAFLLLIGVLALLHEWHWIHFWRFFWPLMLILWGSLLLAERAVLAADGGYPPFPYDSPSGTGVPPYPGQPMPQGQPVSQAYAQPTSGAIVPAVHDFDKGPEGGQS
ncbi:MAG: hypothetical protein ABR976_14240 [Terracidiphilus sp.]|jgi:hypothetical protein